MKDGRKEGRDERIRERKLDLRRVIQGYLKWVLTNRKAINYPPLFKIHLLRR